MNASRWSMLVLTGVLAAGLCWAAQEQEAPHSPRKWLREAAAFKALPPESQRRIRLLDRELNQEESENRDRYFQLLQRYNDWLEGLSAEERRSIDELPTNEARIKRIRELKEQQWIASLPKADRDQILDPRLTKEERQKRVTLARERERQADTDWQMALARLDEQRADTFRPELQQWKRQILAKLKPEERDAKEQEWRKLRPPALRMALYEEALKLDVPVPETLRPYPPVDPARLRVFLSENPQLRREFEARLLDSEKRETAMQELYRHFWAKHQDELRNRDRKLLQGKKKPQ